VYRPMPSGPLFSNYQRFFERNRCNHRDYQLLAWNGARSGSVQSLLTNPNVSAIHRKTSDHPAILFFALVGNDVCNGHPDTIGHMTTVAEFHESITAIFLALDKTLPPKSTVLITGLVDGRFLYDTMHNLIHPIGKTRDDVTYKAVYEFLECLQISPCNGWMSSNATLRNLTTDRAMELNAVYPLVIRELTGRLKNIRIINDGPWPIQEAAKYLKENGLPASALIEPVDGFHPSTLSNFLITAFLWEQKLSTPAFADVVGRVNPYNEVIKDQFGDQGGY